MFPQLFYLILVRQLTLMSIFRKTQSIIFSLIDQAILAKHKMAYNPLFIIHKYSLQRSLMLFIIFSFIYNFDFTYIFQIYVLLRFSTCNICICIFDLDKPQRNQANNQQTHIFCIDTIIRFCYYFSNKFIYIFLLLNIKKTHKQFGLTIGELWGINEIFFRIYI